MSGQTAEAVLAGEPALVSPPIARPATIDDVPAIVELVDEWAAMGLTISRRPEDVEARIDEFAVAELGGAIVSCGALREVGSGIGEIRSIAVASRAKGIGGISQESQSKLLASLKAMEGEAAHAETVHSLVALSVDAWRVQIPSDWESALLKNSASKGCSGQ